MGAALIYLPLAVAGLIVGPTPNSASEGCRVAPYVNMPSLRMAFDRIHMQHLGSHFDTLAAAAAASAAAAAAGNPLAAAAAAGLPPVTSTPGLPGTGVTLPSMLFYPTPHYAVNFAALAQNGLLANKNSSIADLRLKAKHHAASLGLS
jgi:short stature homeobox protein